MASKTNFPTECLEDIFRHLRGNDLLQCALVCPRWENLIGSTKSCMEKIKLLCDNSYNRIKGIKRSLKNSKRKYSCITLRGDYSEGVQKILSMDGKT